MHMHVYISKLDDSAAVRAARTLKTALLRLYPSIQAIVVEDVRIRARQLYDLVLVFEVFKAYPASAFTLDDDILGNSSHLIKEVMATLDRCFKIMNSSALNSFLTHHI